MMHTNGLLIRQFHDPLNSLDNDNIDSITQIVLPYALRGQILNLANSFSANGHLGVPKTRKRIMQYFYWLIIVKDVQIYCRNCGVCQRNGKAMKKAKAPMMTTPL